MHHRAAARGVHARPETTREEEQGDGDESSQSDEDGYDEYVFYGSDADDEAEGEWNDGAVGDDSSDAAGLWLEPEAAIVLYRFESGMTARPAASA